MSKGLHVLRRNSFFAFSSTIIRLFSNAVLFILIARFYGPESFGQFTLAHTLSTIFILLADFGFDLSLTTHIAAHPDQTSFLLPRMLALKLAFSFLASSIMIIVPLLGGLSFQASRLIYIFCFYVFFSAILNFFFALFKGHEEFQHETMISFALNIFLLIALVILGLMAASLYWIAWVFIGSRILGLGLAVIKSRKFLLNIFPKWDVSWIWSIKNRVIYFGLFIIFGNLFFTLDTILLSFWKGDYQVGIYQAVFRIIAITLVIPDIAINTLLPTLTRFYTLDKNKWYQLGSLASKTLFFISLFLGFVIIFGANDIIHFAYGETKFLEAIPILKIFGIIVIIRYSVEIPALMLTTSNRQFIRMILVILATIMNCGINLFAIPRYGAIGAAYTSFATNLLVGIAYFIALRGEVRWNLFSQERIVPFATIILGILLMILCPIPAWTGICILSLVYFPVIYYTGYSEQEKLLLFKKVISPDLI
jgi:O-antigen/teichoic acid export membrane protein